MCIQSMNRLLPTSLQPATRSGGISTFSHLTEQGLTQKVQPWPIIERFLKDLPDGSVGLDVGCGNGKYLAVNPNVFIVGSDRCVRPCRGGNVGRVSSSVG